MLGVRRNLSSLLAPQLPLTQGAREAAEMEPSQQLQGCHPPHVQMQAHLLAHPCPGWVIDHLSLWAETTPAAHLSTQLCKKPSDLLAVLPYPSSACQSSSSGEREQGQPEEEEPWCTSTPAAHPQQHTQGSTEGTWSPSSSHCPARLCSPWTSGGSIFDTSPSSRKVPEEQQCLKPDSNLVLISWYQLLL